MAQPAGGGYCGYLGLRVIKKRPQDQEVVFLGSPYMFDQGFTGSLPLSPSPARPTGLRNTPIAWIFEAGCRKKIGIRGHDGVRACPLQSRHFSRAGGCEEEENEILNRSICQKPGPILPFYRIPSFQAAVPAASRAL